MGSLRKALSILHDRYHVPNVVISSIPLHPWLVSSLPPLKTSKLGPGAHLLCISSTKATVNSTVHTCVFPTIAGYFSGVGDLFSALILAHFDPKPAIPTPVDGSTPLSMATTLSLTKTQYILALTNQHASALPEDERTSTDDELDAKDPDRKVLRMKGRELRLVQGQDVLRLGPTDRFQNLCRMEPWADFWQ
jgi:pyridoxine kinase